MIDIIKLANKIHLNAIKHGWWKEDRLWNDTRILIVSEIAELLEAFRNNQTYKQCDKNINLNYFEEESADVIIRLLDYVGFIVNKLKATNLGIVYDQEGIQLSGSISSQLDMIVAYLYEETKIIKLSIKSIYSLLDVVATVDKFTKNFDNIDIWNAIEIKHKYNKTRPYKHGKEF